MSMQMIGEGVSLQFPSQLVWFSQGGWLYPLSTGNLTDECRCGHRSDVTLVEPLIPKSEHTIETRRSNGNIASIGLIVTISS